MATLLFETREKREQVSLPFRRIAIILRRVVFGSRIVQAALESARTHAFAHAGVGAADALCDFDALAGDCMCQIRPAQLHSVFAALQQQAEDAKMCLDSTISMARDMRARAIELHKRLCNHGETPAAIVNGLKTRLSMQKFYDASGLGPWFAHMSDLQHRTLAFPTSGRSVGTGASMHNTWSSIVQLLTYCYLTGKYKRVEFTGAKKQVLYRLDSAVRSMHGATLTPQALFRSFGDEDLLAVSCAHRKGPSKCSWSTRDESVRFCESEMAIAQT